MSEEKMSDLYKTEKQKEDEKIKSKKQIPLIFNPKIFERHQRYFRIFLSLSILSAIDIGTRQIVYTQHQVSNTGFVSFLVGIIFGIISPVISGIAITLLNFVFSFAIFWVIIAIIEYFHIRKMEKVKNN